MDKALEQAVKRSGSSLPTIVLSDGDYELLRDRKRITCVPVSSPARLRRRQLVRVLPEKGPEVRSGTQYALMAGVHGVRATGTAGELRVDLRGGVLVFARDEDLEEARQHPYKY